jgi:hypothetical protein
MPWGFLTSQCASRAVLAGAIPDENRNAATPVLVPLIVKESLWFVA